MIKGFDVSHHNGVGCIDRIMSKDGDLKFVCIKATEGKTWTDPEFKSNVLAARAHRLLLGAYHFARPDLFNTAAQEVKHFLEECENAGLKVGEFIPILDYEGAAHKSGAVWAREWCDLVFAEIGVRPIIYLSEAYVANYGYVQEGNYGLWVANRKSKVTFSPWKTLAMWQYSSQDYDRNQFFGDPDQWQQYCAVVGDILDDVEADIEIGSGCCGCCRCKEG